MEDEEFEKGRITRQFTMWCGRCHEWEMVSSKTQADAIESFRKTGWKNTSKYGWTCRKHMENEG